MNDRLWGQNTCKSGQEDLPTERSSSTTTDPMVARTASVLEGLTSSDPATRLSALRQVKNQVIGSKAKKVAYVQAGAVPKILELLSSQDDPELVVQSAAALGSLAYGTPVGVEDVLQKGGLVGLVNVLSSSNARVVESAIRALKLVYLQPAPVPTQPILSPPVLPCIISLLGSSTPEVADAAAVVVTRCCRTPEEQLVLTQAGAVEGLVSLLLSTRQSSQAAALEGLAQLVQANPSACQQVLGRPHVLDRLLTLLKERVLSTRLLAATCLTHLCSRAAAGGSSVSSRPVSEGGLTAAASGQQVEQVHSCCDDDEDSVEEAGAGPSSHQLAQLEDARRCTLTVLLRLLADPGLCEQVPPVLAKLIEDSEELQKAALDADAVRLLAALLNSPSTSNTLREGVLRGLGSLCMNRDEGRKQLIDSKVLKHIVRGLQDDCERVRAAGALCIMALTRSVKTLRSTLLETDVAELLCKLIADDSVDVQVNAAAALCNLVLEFSSVKEAVLRHGALQSLAGLTGSMVPTLRLHSCWALRNLAYKSDTTIRRALMKELPWSTMRALLNDSDEGVQEQAICTLRNLCMDSPDHITAAFEWATHDLLAALEEKLDPSRGVSSAISLHALFTVVNILTGSEAHKEAVMCSNLPALLLHHLRTPSDARLPAVWCTINLTWADSSPGVAGRVRKLRELGVEEQLRALQQDPSLDVRERVKTALEQFRAVGSGAAGAATN